MTLKISEQCALIIPKWEKGSKIKVGLDPFIQVPDSTKSDTLKDRRYNLFMSFFKCL